jgi:hypothetical protein
MSNAGRDPVSLTKLAALGAPVLCLDTCIVLDLMRDPTREAVRAHERQAALSLLTALESGTQLVGLVADQVRFEFGENVKVVEEEAERALNRMREQIRRIDAVAAVYGASGSTDLSHLDDHIAQSRAVVDRWMEAVTPAPQSAEIASRALLRLNQVRTPAQKGKDSMKDCVVLETYLDVAAALRTAGLSSKIVFASSNTKDYTGEPGRTLKADVAGEFAGVGMEYAPNLAAAKHLLGM